MEARNVMTLEVTTISSTSPQSELIGLVTSSDLLRVVGALPDDLSLRLPPPADLANGAAP